MKTEPHDEHLPEHILQLLKPTASSGRPPVHKRSRDSDEGNSAATAALAGSGSGKKRRMCPHNRRAEQCKHCGTGYCEHGRRRRQTGRCKDCEEEARRKESASAAAAGEKEERMEEERKEAERIAALLLYCSALGPSLYPMRSSQALRPGPPP